MSGGFATLNTLVGGGQEFETNLGIFSQFRMSLSMWLPWLCSCCATQHCEVPSVFPGTWQPSLCMDSLAKYPAQLHAAYLCCALTYMCCRPELNIVCPPPLRHVRSTTTL